MTGAGRASSSPHDLSTRGFANTHARAASPPWHGGRHDQHDHHRAASPPEHGGRHDQHDRHGAPSRGGSMMAPWGTGGGHRALKDNSMFIQNAAAFNHTLPEHHGNKLQNIVNAGFRTKPSILRQDHASHGDHQRKDGENKSKYSISRAFSPRQDHVTHDGKRSFLRNGGETKHDHASHRDHASISTKRKFSIWGQFVKKKPEKPIESLPSTLSWSHGCTDLAEKSKKMECRSIAIRPTLSRARTKLKEWEDLKAGDDEPTNQSKAQALWQVAQAVREGAKKTCRERSVAFAFLKIAADKKERVRLEAELDELSQLSHHQGDAAHLPPFAELFKAFLHELSCMKLDGKVEIEMMHEIREVMHKLNALKGMYSMGSQTVKGLRPQIDKMVKEVNHQLFIMKGKLHMVRRDMQAMCSKVMKELKELKEVPEDSVADVGADHSDQSEEDDSLDIDGPHALGFKKDSLMRRVAVINNFETCILDSLLEKIEVAVDDVSHAATACGDTVHSQQLVLEGAALEEQHHQADSQHHQADWLHHKHQLPHHRLHAPSHRPRLRHRRADPEQQKSFHMYRFDDSQQSSESETIHGFGLSSWAVDSESRSVGGAESSGRLVWAKEKQQWGDQRTADTPCIDEFEADCEAASRTAGGSESSGRLKTRPKRKFQKGSDDIDSFDADFLETKAIGGSQSPHKLWAQPRSRRESLEETPSPSPSPGRLSSLLETPVTFAQERLESPFLWVPPSPLDKSTSPPPSRRGKRKAHKTKPIKHRNSHRLDTATMTVEAVLADREERGLRSRTSRAAEGASDADAEWASPHPLASPEFPTVCTAWVAASGD